MAKKKKKKRPIIGRPKGSGDDPMSVARNQVNRVRQIESNIKGNSARMLPGNAARSFAEVESRASDLLKLQGMKAAARKKLSKARKKKK